MATFQSYVHHAAKTDLSESELFTKEDTLLEKEKQFVLNLSAKASSELTSKESQKLKEIARKHVPSSVRVQLWLLLSGGSNVKTSTPGLYADVHEELFNKGDFIPDGMEEDRAFLTYYLTSDGGHKLRQVMCIIKHLNPDITYCPLMEPIVSILLHFMDEADCFAVVTGLLSNKSNPFLAQTKFHNITADATIQDLLKNSNRKAFERIESFLSSEKDEQKKVVLLPSWRRMIFEQLDFVCLVRILDCLMVEGSKILYRIGMYLLDAFYEYSMTFRKLECSSPHDLLHTIGQHAHSLQMTPENLLKDAMKISITTKQMEKYNLENGILYKSNQLDYTDDISTHQVVAVDLNQVSDIIKPPQWQEVCQWLPQRIQLQQPHLLFSTDTDGYNLKTLYLQCEEEEQTLLIIKTTTKEIFGAYLSRPLIERHDGHSNLSYFGTGETFIFKLVPDTICYHWNQPSFKHRQQTNAKSKYVFMDTTPLVQTQVDDIDNKPKKSNRKKSFKRSLSLTSKSTKATSEPKVVKNADPHPVSLINIRRNATSVPRHLYLGKGLGFGDSPISTSKTSTIDVCAEPSGNPKLRDTEPSGNPKLRDTKTAAFGESFEIIDEKTAPESIVKADTLPPIDEHGITKNSAVELFISCDTSRLVVGGGGGEAIWIDGEISNGRSMKCDTFLNAPLTSNTNGDFIIARLDLFGFQ